MMNDEQTISDSSDMCDDKLLWSSRFGLRLLNMADAASVLSECCPSSKNTMRGQSMTAAVFRARATPARV